MYYLLIHNAFPPESWPTALSKTLDNWFYAAEPLYPPNCGHGKQCLSGGQLIIMVEVVVPPARGSRLAQS